MKNGTRVFANCKWNSHKAIMLPKNGLIFIQFIFSDGTSLLLALTHLYKKREYLK